AGTISGTPTAAGSSNVTIQVADSAQGRATKAFTLQVTAELTIVTATLAPGTVGTPYSQPLQATGGTAPFTWSVASGQLPQGLTLSAAGTISGTPTAAGSANMTIQVA